MSDPTKLIYGNPVWEHVDRINNSILLREWIKAGHFLPLLSMTPPCEITTQHELWYLVDRARQVTPERMASIQRMDDALDEVWADYLTTLGITTTPEYIRNLMNTYEVIVDYLKVKFNRPRPFQTAAHYGIPLYPRLRGACGDGASAYPSGHTFISLVVYDHFVRQHPTLHKELMLMVLRVKQSREDGGVHYPSDGLFSFQVYQHLKPLLHHPMTPGVVGNVVGNDTGNVVVAQINIQSS